VQRVVTDSRASARRRCRLVALTPRSNAIDAKETPCLSHLILLPTEPPLSRMPRQARLERWYAHPGLYRWSLSNPLTRWLTRRRTRRLFDLMAGFVHSQVLLACVRLDLFRTLHQAPADLDTVAQRTGLAASAFQRLPLSAAPPGLP